MKNDESGEIGRILERALSNYSLQELPAGLEDRVLQYVFAAPAKPRFWGEQMSRFVRPGPVFTAIAAALLLILVPISRFHHHSVPVASQVKPRAEWKAPAAGNVHLADSASTKLESIETVAGTPLKRADAGSARGVSLPKQAKFPTPSPITDEERALLELARSAPDEAFRMTEDQAQPDIAPIQLEAMHISPLHIDSLQEGGVE